MNECTLASNRKFLSRCFGTLCSANIISPFNCLTVFEWHDSLTGTTWAIIYLSIKCSRYVLFFSFFIFDRRHPRTVLWPAAALWVRRISSGSQLPLPRRLRGSRQTEPGDNMPLTGRNTQDTKPNRVTVNHQKPFFDRILSLFYHTGCVIFSIPPCLFPSSS